MPDETSELPDVVADFQDWVKWHAETYISSGGTQGHILDQSAFGGTNFTTTLILRTIGRKSGQVRYIPLIYGLYGGEAVVVASKGGADTDPEWYRNIEQMDEVQFQIGAQAFRATWRTPVGEECEAVFAYMIGLFPPYREYRQVAKREIPLVMLKRVEEISAFS